MLTPDPAAWRAALARSPDDDDREFRREVGLPDAGPIVMSGHQPTFWHPGILAKWIAMVRGADVFEAHAAWLVVDHDAIAPARVRLPLLVPDGSLVAHECDLSSGDYQAAVPASARAATPARLPALHDGQAFALDSVREGVNAMALACAAFAASPSAAVQVAHAAAKIIHEGILNEHRPPTIVLATSLHHSLAFRRLVAKMVQDPERCARSYNEAVAARPHARLRPMAISKGDCELPLWWLRDGTRRDVRASDLTVLLASGPEAAWSTLAPKALFMTLLLRLHGCELFIHGLGGGGSGDAEGYDHAMQDWATRWLGSVTLAPMATVSAELLQRGATGLFHIAGSERLSRWEIGQLLVARWGEGASQLRAGSLRDHTGPTRAPDTTLNCAKAQALLSFPLPKFSEWLRDHPAELF